MLIQHFLFKEEEEEENENVGNERQNLKFDTVKK